MSAASSPTLLHDLLAPRPGVDRKSFPATDLIYKLLHHTGADVSAFRRNCQISYRLIEYARDLYDEINARILIAEESGSWEHYDAYYSAIDPLEEALLTIMEVTEIERDEYLVVSPLPPLDQPVDIWIKKFISDWQTNRTKIRESFQDLRTQGELKGFISPPDDQNEIENAKFHDDRTLLKNLLREIGDNESKVASDASNRGKPESADMVRKVKEGLQSALDYLKGTSKKALGDDLGVLAIKSGMIIYGVTEIMKTDGIKQHPEVYDRFYGAKIWETAQKLVASIHDNLKGHEKAPNLAGLDQIYKELEAALTGELPALMHKIYFEIFPLMWRVGRAYHAQSLFLGSLCYKITRNCQHQIYDTYDALVKALSKTMEAFITAIKLDSKPLLYGTSIDYTENGAISNVADVGDLQKQLEDARIKDKERLSSYNARITKDIPPRELIGLTLLVYHDNSDGEPSLKLHAKVLQTARLSYIKWLATKNLQGAEFLHFESPAEKEPLDLDIDLKLLVQDNNCTLHVIVKKELAADGNQQ